MTSVTYSRGREIGGLSSYDKYHDRSSSRGALLHENRSERYGRGSFQQTDEQFIRRDRNDGAGPDTEMRRGGGGGGYRDSGDFRGSRD